MYPVSGSLFGESGGDSAVITVRQYRVDGIPFYRLSVYAMVGARIARASQGKRGGNNQPRTTWREGDSVMLLGCYEGVQCIHLGDAVSRPNESALLIVASLILGSGLGVART